jgi:CheY-like chemotaxis protein
MRPAVLLVEADAPSGEALHLLLEEAGYAVSDAADGPAALALLRLNLTRKRPHRLVVLLHHALPEVDGAGVLRTIAEDPHLATHHAYVLLDAAQEPVVPTSADAPSSLTVSVMPWPFDQDALLRAVAEAAGGLGMEPEGAGRRD